MSKYGYIQGLINLDFGQYVTEPRRKGNRITGHTTFDTPSNIA